MLQIIVYENKHRVWKTSLWHKLVFSSSIFFVWREKKRKKFVQTHFLSQTAWNILVSPLDFVSEQKDWRWWERVWPNDGQILGYKWIVHIQVGRKMMKEEEGTGRQTTEKKKRREKIWTQHEKSEVVRVSASRNWVRNVLVLVFLFLLR